MSIASAITAAQGRVADAYTAISNKGGTLPATQNLSNMPTAIASIPSGITPTGTISITTNGTTDVTNYATANVNVVSRKYGASIDTFLGNVDANGVLQPSVEMPDLLFTGVTDVASYGLYYRFVLSRVKSVSFPNLTTISGFYGCYYTFSGCSSLTSISFPSLTTISGSYGCYNMFSSCSSLTSISFPSLTTISGSNGCYYMFNRCTSLTSVSFPNLTTITGSYGCYGMLYYCTSLTSVSFPNLTTISGSNGCYYMFSACTSLTDVYFPALTTTSFGSNVNQFNSMLATTGNTTTHTLHFPSNLESTISNLTGYPLFGGTSGYVVCAFDLPATS